MNFSSTCAIYIFKPCFSFTSFVDRKPCAKAPRLNSSPISIHQTQTPYFHLFYEKVAGRLRLVIPAVSPSGFGYPLGDVGLSASQEASFSSRRSRVSPFKAFLLPVDRNKVSFVSFRSCAFSENLIGFLPTLQRFDPS